MPQSCFSSNFHQNFNFVIQKFRFRSPKLDDTASAPLPLAALGLQQEYPKRESVSESIRRWSVHADVVHDRTSMTDVIGEIRARSEVEEKRISHQIWNAKFNSTSSILFHL